MVKVVVTESIAEANSVEFDQALEMMVLSWASWATWMRETAVVAAVVVAAAVAAALGQRTRHK